MGTLSTLRAVAQPLVCAIDANTGKPVEYVHLVFEEQGGKKWLQVGGLEGCSPNKTERNARVTATFVGYQSISDSIAPGQSLNIKLLPGTQELNPVVVTAQYGPTQSSESVQNVRVIDAQRLQERGAVTLDQALNDQLNLRIANDGVFGSSLSIQGLSGEHVKVLLDGVPVVGRLDGQLDLSQIPTNSIERIEIIEGPMSVNYGSNALAGVVNIISKRNEAGKIRASADMLYESFGQTNFGANLSMPLPGYQKLTADISAGRNFFDGWSAVDTGQRSMDWNQKELWFVDGKLTHPLGRGQLVGRWMFTDELVKDKGERRSPFSDYAFDTWFGTRRQLGSLSYSAPVGLSDRVEILASFSDFLRTNTLYNRNLVEGWQELSPGLSSADTNRATQWLSRGTYARNRERDSTSGSAISWQLGYEVSLEQASGDRIEGANRRIEDYAAFGSLRWNFAPKWTLQPALRVSYNSAFAAQPVPSVHLKARLHPSLQLRASYARGFRTPSIKELYLEFVDANHNLYGNPELTAEYSHHADLGLQWTHSKDAVHRWSLEPLFFFNRVFEQIELAQIDEVRYSYVNLASTQSVGFRIELGYEIHPDFKFRTGASHIWQAFESGSGDAKTYQSPEFSAGFDYWRPSKRFGFQTTYRYQGSSPLVALGEDGVELGSLEDFHYLECSATEKFWKGKIQWTIGGRNLLDVQSLAVSNAGSGVHSGAGSRPMFRGRSFFTSIKIALN